MGTTPIDYDLLAIFVAVANEASFSRAAVKLGIGKGTVSRAIARLESVVGAELLHRTTHKVALSTAGMALFERSAPHLSALDQALGGLPERDEQPSGELRMTAPHDFGVIILPEILTQFAARYPAVAFDVRLTNARVDLVAEGFDLAIRAADTMKDSTLTARKLGRFNAGLFAAPSYLARRGTPKSFGDPKHDWVMFTPVLGAAPVPPNFRPRYRTDDFFMLQNLLRQGAGIGPLPTFVAERQVAKGELEALFPRERFRGKGGYFLVYPSSGQVPRKVSAFSNFLVERLKTHALDS